MNIKCAAAAASFLFLFGILANGQGTVVINDPTATAKETKLTASDEALINRDALPKIKAKFAENPCEVELETAGVVHGSFTRSEAKQTLVFFQICQTGNGLGIVGLVLIENGKVLGNFASDGGWSADIGLVPDINQNGVDEFVLAYSGGLHQGQGGIGVDLMEFSGNTPKGLGWYKAEEFDETEASKAWKLTAKPGKIPVFYRQKYISVKNNKWRRVGANTVFKLGKAYSKFTTVK